MRTIYFDMDGTIADLYGVENWLDYLIAEDTTPYAVAKPLVDMEELADALAELKKIGFKIGIISWLSKKATEEYNKAVRDVKKAWLKAHLNIELDEIHIVKYGTRKDYVAKDKNGILFDDEEDNRNYWRGQAYDVENILEILTDLLDK